MNQEKKSRKLCLVLMSLLMMSQMQASEHGVDGSKPHAFAVSDDQQLAPNGFSGGAACEVLVQVNRPNCFGRVAQGDPMRMLRPKQDAKPEEKNLLGDFGCDVLVTNLRTLLFDECMGYRWSSKYARHYKMSWSQLLMNRGYAIDEANQFIVCEFEAKFKKQALDFLNDLSKKGDKKYAEIFAVVDAQGGDDVVLATDERYKIWEQEQRHAFLETFTLDLQRLADLILSSKKVNAVEK